MFHEDKPRKEVYQKVANSSCKSLPKLRPARPSYSISLGI